MGKGVEPIVAAVILVLITVAAWSVVSGWIKITAREQAENIENRTEQKLRCAYADLYIDSVQVNCSRNCTAGNHTVLVWIKNSGEVKLEINSISIVNKSGELFNFGINETSIFNVGDLLNLTNSSDISCTGFNATSKIEEIIVTSRNCPDTYDSFDGNDVTFIEC